MSNSRASLARWLWNHNPFYVISALLMLYGVGTAYGEQNIGAIDCWKMTGILGSYTLLLAVIGVLIVRWGQVWDDARSILLLLLLLFLAVSVSADDLFVKMESAQGGVALLACGFGFSVAILLGVLSATRIRLKAVYVVPLILFLGLFFIAPWWCSPELHPKFAMTIDWTLFLFPQIAAILLLTLIPAARLGQKSVQNNGTPWPWPLFPWSAFVFIGIAVVLRSYALTMTFSPSGHIWTSPDAHSGIVLDTIWRPYFLVPFALAVLILLLEAGLASGNRQLVSRVLLVAPALLPMAWPWNPSEVMLVFLSSLTANLGSPIWLCVWFLIAFYGWATLRRAAFAELGLLSSLLMFSVVGPQTIDLATLSEVNSLPLFVVGIVLGFVGIRKRSTPLTLAAAGITAAAMWVVLPMTPLTGFRLTTCYHMLLLACVLISVLWKDRWAKRLQIVGAVMLTVSACFVFNGQIAAQIPWSWRISYVAALAVLCYLCAHLSHVRAYWAGFVGTISVFGYAIAVEGFRNAASTLGREAMAAFSWSVGTLLIGVLISAHKARWLPPLALPGWLESASLPTDLPDQERIIIPDVDAIKNPGNP